MNISDLKALAIARFELSHKRPPTETELAEMESIEQFKDSFVLIRTSGCQINYQDHPKAQIQTTPKK